ncbi:uncharacterized protein BXZ73DRAFT_107311 [Epithele typhae]|uniref:uncharacterized protein n=1 Tax=Epithele typhae TaxID=378194 RepID=UPI002007DF2D|nr:uncharacterized protein BXZ73DRAFT_107311 [Epithele typhae]KAH9912675.1 hypothetical protein BXZ73DRAFT_107311 [Epithele typhae]
MPMAAALNHATKHKSRCPGFVFEIAATHSVRQDRRGFMKPDICCYTRSNHDIVRAAEPSSRVDFGFAELFIDISPDPARDAFTDPPRGSVDHELLSFSPSNRKNVSIHDLFGQHVSYVAEIFDRQPRCLLFTVIMHGSRTRLLRWDRAGCVVTEGFDATDAGRGHDTSVKHALQAEEELFAGVLRQHLQLQIADYEDLEKAVGQHYVPGRVYTTDILHHRLSAADENTRKFVFSRPAASSRSLAGPGTRGYWAVDVTMKKIVFIKDTWRHSGVEEVQGDTLRRLDDMGVRFVPSFVWHGDVSRMEVYPEERRRLSSRHFTAFGTWRYMSIRVLSWSHDYEGQHRFEDDMESLLYVVICMALLWQPHKIHRRELAGIFAFIFDQTEEYTAENEVFGGSGKISNAEYRLSVTGHRFLSKDLATWLDMMMNYHSPAGRKADDTWNKPGFIYDFWTQFLREHSSSLETNNRQEHPVITDDGLEATSDTHDRQPLFPDTTTGERAEAIARHARRMTLLAERAREEAGGWLLEILNRSPPDMENREGHNENAEDQTLGKRDRSPTEEQPSLERRVSKRLKAVGSLAQANVRAAPVTLLSSRPVGSVRRGSGNSK